MDGEEPAKSRAERGPDGERALRLAAGGTTPEPPGRTGTGPPVTAKKREAVVSSADGPKRRRKAKICGANLF